MSHPQTLLKAVRAGRVRQVRLLLDLGSSTEEADDCGQTPLIRAIFIDNDRNRDKIVKTLLRRGAIVSHSDVVGRNALTWACVHGRDTDVALLLEFADVNLDYNKTDINGQTPLFHAVTSGNAATVKLMVSALARYGLSVDEPDFNSTTPLMQAQRLGHDICESILVFEGGAKVGLSDSNFEISRREKWAVSSLRDLSKVKATKSRVKPSQFPPIASINLTSSDSPKIDSRKQYFGVRALDSDGESSSNESDEIAQNNVVKVSRAKKNVSDHHSETRLSRPQANRVRNCRQNIPAINIPTAVMTPSANDADAESGEESDEDSVASTIVEGRATGLQAPPVDIVSLYDAKQQQMSSSFRKTVHRVEKPCADEWEATPEAKKGEISFIY